MKQWLISHTGDKEETMALNCLCWTNEWNTTTAHSLNTLWQGIARLKQNLFLTDNHRLQTLHIANTRRLEHSATISACSVDTQ